MNKSHLKLIEPTVLLDKKKKCEDQLDSFDAHSWYRGMVILIEEIYRARAKMDVHFLSDHITYHWTAHDVLQVGDFQCCYEVIYEMMRNMQEMIIDTVVSEVDECLFEDYKFIKSLRSRSSNVADSGIELCILLFLSQKERLTIDFEELEYLKDTRWFFTPKNKTEIISKFNKELYSRSSLRLFKAL